MKWISSLDELVFEMMSWLLFFPITLWRSVSRPLKTMVYADDQLSLPEEEQYAAVLSPPLFLALSLLLAEGISIALGQADPIVASHQGLAGLVNDQRSELVVRIVVFAAFCLFGAARLVRARGLPLDRHSLRAPFYAQCYPTAAFALILGLATSLMLVPGQVTMTTGAILAVMGVIFYLVVQTRWFSRELSIGFFRAFANVVLVMAQSIALMIVVGLLFSH